MRNINVLFTDQSQLLLVLERIERSIAQKSNQLNKELRPHHIHFLILMANINNACIKVIVISLQHGHKNGIFTLFLPAILVQFLIKVTVFMLGFSRVSLVFHFKHDGKNLNPILISFTKDKVPLGTRSR